MSTGQEASSEDGDSVLPLTSIGDHHGVPPPGAVERRKVTSLPAQTHVSHALKLPLVSSSHRHDPVGRDPTEFRPP
jgi:hypothetical protein